MSRTRTIFLVIVGLALIATFVGVTYVLLWRTTPSSGVRVPARQSSEPIQVLIASALSVEPWVSEAARKFNAEERRLEGRVIRV
ncbi:MAG: hypothetical protein NZ765_05320, partial [Anaerolineae bacterium]|nr:hypothetical protein [Anaerolineae bacterium]MDW8071698.1 hypothetical protein [Anaerolineae bacterium]